MGVRHYRIDKGTYCEVRRPGGVDWYAHTMERRMWFTSGVEDGSRWWVLTTPEGWSIRVERHQVHGSAANEPATAETVVLTRELLNRARNGNGDFTGDQMKVLGLTRPLLKGWLSALVGKRIGAEEYRKLVALKKPLNPRPGTHCGVPT